MLVKNVQVKLGLHWKKNKRNFSNKLVKHSSYLVHKHKVDKEQENGITYLRFIWRGVVSGYLIREWEIYFNNKSVVPDNLRGTPWHFGHSMSFIPPLL